MKKYCKIKRKLMSRQKLTQMPPNTIFMIMTYQVNSFCLKMIISISNSFNVLPQRRIKHQFPTARQH